MRTWIIKSFSWLAMICLVIHRRVYPDHNLSSPLEQFPVAGRIPSKPADSQITLT
jgi:hypothetical protein